MTEKSSLEDKGECNAWENEVVIEKLSLEDTGIYHEINVKRS
jgi:hypothetical protein